jgi:hypothetical protein
MRRTSALVMLAAVLVGLSLTTCDALKTIEVTLDISGNPLAGFTGFYETTTHGQQSISGSPPKSYTFEARKQYDIVAAQLAYAGVGDLTAKLVSGGVTRDSETISTIGTISLTWTPK